MIPAVFLALGILLGVVAFARPSLGVYLLALFSLIIGGTVQYFFPVAGFVLWVAPVISFFLLLAAIAGKKVAGSGFLPLKWLVLFVAAGVCSFATNFGYLGEFVAEAKNYYMFLSLPVVAVFTRLDAAWISRAGKVVLWAAFMQAPVALFQHFVVVDYASRSAGGDSIVGTFGGSAIGGGASGAQTAFLVVMLAWLMARYFAKNIGLLRLGVYSGILLIPILLNETKIFFIYLPTAFGMLALTHMRSNPGQVMVMLLMGGTLFVSVLVFYFTYVQHGQDRNYADSVSEYLERTVLGNATRVDRAKDGGLGRIATYPYWWESNSSGDLIAILFGHGVGSTKSSGQVVGHLQLNTDYAGKGIATTGVAKLLWELGVFGAIVYCSIFASVYRSASKIRKHTSTRRSEKVELVTIQVAVVILIGGLFYSDYVFRNQALNFLSMAMVAYSMYLASAAVTSVASH